jgi:hypothetical protein
MSPTQPPEVFAYQANRRAIERLQRENRLSLLDGFSTKTQIQAIRLLDSVGVNATTVMMSGFEIVDGGVIFRQMVLRRDGSRVLRHRGSGSEWQPRVRGRFVATPRTGA